MKRVMAVLSIWAIASSPAWGSGENAYVSDVVGCDSIKTTVATLPPALITQFHKVLSQGLADEASVRSVENSIAEREKGLSEKVKAACTLMAKPKEASLVDLATNQLADMRATLLMNQKPKQVGMMLAAQSATEAAAAGVSAGLAEKQKQDMDALIAQIKNAYKLVATPSAAATFDDKLVKECDLTPGLPQCQAYNAWKGQQSDFAGATTLDLGNGAASNSFVYGGSGESGSNSAALAQKGSADANKMGSGTGDSLGNFGANSGGGAFEGGAVGAAGVKNSGPGGGGGGGGGGAGGVAGPGLSKGADASAPEGRKEIKPTGSAVSYATGKSAGGAGVNYNDPNAARKGSLESGDENPFAKFFDKKDGAGERGGSLNFRGTASNAPGVATQEGSLFHRISGRYRSVINSNRLVIDLNLTQDVLPPTDPATP